MIFHSHENETYYHKKGFVVELVAVDENREKNSDTLSSFLDTFRQSIRLSTISCFSFSIND